MVAAKRVVQVEPDHVTVRQAEVFAHGASGGTEIRQRAGSPVDPVTVHTCARYNTPLLLLLVVLCQCHHGVTAAGLRRVNALGSLG